MSLGDRFPDSLKEDFARRNVRIGKSILIRIPDVQKKYDKYIIIVSENEKEISLAFVVINSRINEKVFPSPYLKSLHVKIDSEKHPFLDHDSYINCSELRTFTKQEVVDFLIEHPERAVGNVRKEVLQEVLQTISVAKTIPSYLKKKFGF